MTAHLERSGIIAAGNFIVDSVKLIDHWPEQDSLALIWSQSLSNGGGPYNVLRDLAQLGATYPLAALGRVGDDAYGAWIREDCSRHGIDTSCLLATPGESTSYTDVMTVQGSGRRTFFHQAGANARLAESDFDLRTGNARLFYLGYLLLLDGLDRPGADGRPAAASVLARARASGLCTVLDCVSEASERFSTVVRPVLPEVDILFANDFEAERLTGRQVGRGASINHAEMFAAAGDLLAAGVREAVVIHAPEGACLRLPGTPACWQPSVAMPPHLIAGTSGAGDALAAGFLHGWHERWTPQAALKLGVCTAAASLCRPGCSEGVLPAADCLTLGLAHGFQNVPPNI